MSGPKSTTSAWSIFRHQDRGESWTRSDRITRDLATLHEGPLVHLARELACLQTELSSDESLAVTLLFLALMLDVENGSTRMDIRSVSVVGHFNRLFSGSKGAVAPPDIETLAETASSLVQTGRLHHIIGPASGEGRPFVLRGGSLHEDRLLTTELHLADSVRDRLVPELNVEAASAPSSIQGFGLTQEQERAVMSALSSRLTLVSGGPGTGKTSIIVAIIVAAIERGVSAERIVLAAPTGKAAWRMGESIRSGLQSTTTESDATTLTEDPQTLHRLLGYQPARGGYKHHRGDPLDADLILVDEASMIDTVLMERLFSATAEHAKLVLLGDAQQLPSVRAGAVFRNLTSACGARCVTLTKNFRMRPEDPDGANILRVAETIKVGHSIKVDDLTASIGVEQLLWRGVESLNLTEDRIDRFADRWYERAVYTSGQVTEESLESAFQRMESCRLLSVTRNGLDGVIKWNERLHGRHARHNGVSAQQEFVSGEPVMMLRNDYGRGLFNGDQGLVLERELEGKRALWVAFRHESHFRFFLLSGLHAHLEHCYAMTVHKSQGSEFEYVAVQLPDRDSSILTRELIYTAVTRSRRSVVFLGTAARLNDAISRPVIRSSALDELIIAAYTDADVGADNG